MTRSGHPEVPLHPTTPLLGKAQAPPATAMGPASSATSGDVAGTVLAFLSWKPAASAFSRLPPGKALCGQTDVRARPSRPTGSPRGMGRVVGSPEAGAQGFAAAGLGLRPPGRTQHAAPRWPASGPGCPDASGGFSQSGSVPVFGGARGFQFACSPKKEQESRFRGSERQPSNLRRESSALLPGDAARHLRGSLLLRVA